MVRGKLVRAFDFKARKDVKCERYSYREEDQWYLVEVGPKYSNILKITSFDDQGLEWLEGIEQQGE